MADVLVVEDDADLRKLIDTALHTSGFGCCVAPSGAEALQALADADFDLVLTDIRMPGMNGIELCERVTGDRPDIPVVVMTAFDQVDLAVAALRAGAADFVVKPFGVLELTTCLERVLDSRRPSAMISRLPSTNDGAERIPELTGDSPAMAATVKRILNLAATDGTVLITGESGTGKELVARALHARSARRDGPFIAASCPAMPAALLESELFGHERGAYTGAVSREEGLFVKASGGTIFLDEIGAMPLELQPKLLRALEVRAARSVGGSHEVPFDSRVVAATNRDLEQAVSEGQFRADLLFRLNAFHVHLPPLRDRGDDVVLLAERFLRRYAEGDAVEFTPEARQRLLGYSWPGNVRELENCVQACVAVADDPWIGLEELPTQVRTRSATGASPQSSTLAELERQHIALVLDAVSGNKAAAARQLGIDRTTLYRKLRRLGIDAPAR